MPSSEHPDLPEGWAGTRTDARLYLAIAVLVTIAVISLLTGLAAARAGNFTAVKYCAVFALIIALVAAFPAVDRSRRLDLSAAIRTVELEGVPMTEIRYSARKFRLLIALMTTLTIFCLTAAIEIFMRQDEGFPGGSVLTGAFGLLFASFLVAVASGRIRRGGITLSSQGIAQQGQSFESRLDWPHITVITPASIGYNRDPVVHIGGYANANWVRRHTTRIWRIDRLPKMPMIQLYCRQFGVDPYALYSYMRAYVENPELRGELGTKAALTRARHSHLAK